MKKLFLYTMLLVCLCLVACARGEAKSPIDYPNTKWVCEEAGIEFVVSSDGIQKSEILDKNGQVNEVEFVFGVGTDTNVYVKDCSSGEDLFSGECIYGKTEFSITITDFHTNFNHLPLRLNFKQVS